MEPTAAALKAIENFRQRGDAHYAMSLYRLFNTDHDYSNTQKES